MKKLVVVLLLIVVGVGAFLYFPRGGTVTSASNAATLAILNTAIEGARAGSAFVPALDGEVYASGDLVRANVDGRAVLTFFDGSSLSVDPGSQVKVVALNRVSTDGMQVTIEQSLGRSWSSVQKLKTPDSRYEVRTPSTVAAVRGTGFLTFVQQLATGGTQTTYQVDAGTLQVTANAGGTVSVPAGTQVTIAEGAVAPASATPIAPSPRLEINGSPGLGFLVVAPTGQACGTAAAGGKDEVFGCVVSGDKVTVRDPAGGRWGFFLVSPSALGVSAFTVDVFVGATSTVRRIMEGPLIAGQMVRSGITVTSGPPLGLSALEPAMVVNSVCAATAPGRVFASGPVDGRADTVKTFARDNKATPVSLVFTEDELNQVVDKNAPSGSVTLSDAKIRIDAGGIHGTAKAATQLITLNASADVVGGSVGDKFTLRVSHLAADPLPPGLIDAVKGIVDATTADISGAVPFLVRQVAFRNGCFWVSGVTAN